MCLKFHVIRYILPLDKMKSAAVLCAFVAVVVMHSVTAQSGNTLEEFKMRLNVSFKILSFLSGAHFNIVFSSA